MSAGDGQATCLEHSANLASLHSYGEFYFVRQLIIQAAGSVIVTWIGGNDAVKEGKWFWSDGSKMDYQIWNKGQPDDYKGKEDCLQFSFVEPQQWNDGECTEHNPFICALK
ncbi:hypothetical protein NFI96_010761 [Prochilodus magdalenae]|nr:hypothetical protein NFI96_010761 [Prochilodus magdalenae]